MTDKAARQREADIKMVLQGFTAGVFVHRDGEPWAGHGLPYLLALGRLQHAIAPRSRASSKREDSR
jgi:hypothetical protein